jgi:hypothetical protein
MVVFVKGNVKLDLMRVGRGVRIAQNVDFDQGRIDLLRWRYLLIVRL